MDFSLETLQKDAVSYASVENTVAVFGGCNSADVRTFNEMMETEFPLAMWLMNTPYARTLRNRINSDLKNIFMDGNKIKVNIPGEAYSIPRTQGADECCWVPDDLAKCGGTAEIKTLCLKDSENIGQSLIFNNIRLNDSTITVEEERKLIALRSLALHTAITVVQGTLGAFTDLTKPFQGLAEVLQNPAITSIDASACILGAFDIVACRLAVVGGHENSVFWMHPLTLNAVKAELKKDINGNLPAGWSITDQGNVFFEGVPLRADKFMMYDFQNSTGTIVLLNGNNIGAVLGATSDADYGEGSRFVRNSYGYSANGCGADTVYYFNYGTVALNNANKALLISNVATSANCVQAVQDLQDVLATQTIVPKK